MLCNLLSTYLLFQFLLIYMLLYIKTIFFLDCHKYDVRTPKETKTSKYKYNQ